MSRTDSVGDKLGDLAGHSNIGMTESLQSKSSDMRSDFIVLDNWILRVLRQDSIWGITIPWMYSRAVKLPLMEIKGDRLTYATALQTITSRSRHSLEHSNLR